MTEEATQPRHGRRERRRGRRILIGAAIAMAVILVTGVGAVAAGYLDVTTGLHRSALKPVTTPKPGATTTDRQATNILIMGLDSRLDENGNPLPAAVYQALHAGDGSVGGYNSNVLMLIHIPAGSGQAVGISIPRDDWVSLPGAPDGVSMGKIKEAYGYELDAKLRHLRSSQPSLSQSDAYQQARAAARQEEVATVSQFLGGVPIDHFIEVTMAAFYQIAVAVQPIEVCLNEATQDTFSGANFHAGVQELNAAQAVSFVRQRRNTGRGVALTDLDRDRRQQAFIVALAYKLRHENFFTNLGLMQQLIDTAKQNIAIDDGLDLLSFAAEANRFAGGGISFDVLPVQRFGVEDGKDVNIVDLTQIRSVTAGLIATSDASSTPAPSPTATAGTASPAPPPAGASTTTTSASQPLASGAIPCVN